MNIEPVKLGVGEEVKIIPYLPNPLSFRIGDVWIEELIPFNGSYWIWDSKYISSVGNKIFRKFNSVIPIQPFGAMPFYSLNLKAKPEELPSVKKAIDGLLEDIQIRGELHPSVNGIVVFKRGGRDVVEPVRNGDDYVLVGHDAFIEAQLLRYVPATPENKEKLSGVYESIFNSKRL